MGYAVAFALYCLMGITDYFDGYLARSSGAVSRLGIFLDPIADKIMVASVILMLVGTRDIRRPPRRRRARHPAARDRGVGPARVSGAVAGVRPRCRGWAKWKTTLQLVALAR